MTIPRARSLLAGVLVVLVVLCGVAACSGGTDPGPVADEGPTTTVVPSTVASTLASSSTTAPIPEDAVWVLGEPDLTFVRVDHADSVPLGSNTDVDTPIVAGTEVVIEYRTPAGDTVLVEQADLVHPDDTMAYVVDAGGAGYPPSLTTIVGTTRVAITGPEDDLRRFADSLEPITPAALAAMVDEVTAGIIDAGLSESVVDGITLHRPTPGADAVACLDGQEPEACAPMDRYGPLVMAPIPTGETFTVVGCIDQPIPVTEVTVADEVIPVQPAACGQAFSVPDIAPGPLAITFDDGPGGVGTYTFTLP